MFHTDVEIRELVIQSLHEFLNEKSGTCLITETTVPITDLGLDSADGIDLACALSDKLRYHIPDDLNPLVADGSPCHARTVKEIIELIQDLVHRQEEIKNA